MLASSRLAAANGSRLAGRSVVGGRICQRFQSTQSAPSGVGPYIAAGAAGGTFVLLGGYTYYHFSGAKQAVDATKNIQVYYKQAKDTISEKAKNPSEALLHLRSIVKSYAGIVPGVSSYIDSSFDTIEELHEKHGEDLDQILNGAYEDIMNVVKDVKSPDGGVDAATTAKLVDVLRKRLSELNDLGKKAGLDVVGKLEVKYPQVASTLESSYGELKSLAERSGPEAKKFVEDSIKEVKDIVSSDTTPEALNRAKDLVQSKSKQLKEMVWNRALEEAKSKPEIKELLNQYKDTFLAAGASTGSLSEVIQKVKQMTKEGVDKEKINEVRKFVEEKSKQAQNKGWDGLQEWVKSVPGGDEALKRISESDIDLQALMQLSQKKGQDAKQLAEETYQEIFKVLQEKAGKAKKIVEEGKDEVKK
ncbi:hypothetical protein PHLCEN_2v6529 [Hermanssonia centrifuga]|uniref:Uncharacterized protein n=1 Tax=Hermanssonia centrifuga TaxID=98765 RepID=A0A2R6NZD9_9APHY|nr:hypothetical protein PHLCEN_2v6529 [Hermanssonia centrifuga]